MLRIRKIILFFIISTIICSCQKQLSKEKAVLTTSKYSLKIPENFFKEAPVPGVVQNPNSKVNIATAPSAALQSLTSTVDPNNGDTSIILGNQLTNPYTVANMQQAYNLLYGNGVTLSANYLYVRFKPADVDQLETLKNNGDLELQDYPMDYDVVQDGDYYQDPTLGTEDIGWLYAVVPAGYAPPEGIVYKVISPLYLPNDNLLLEDMAESIAAGGVYTASVENGVRVIIRTDISGVEPYYPIPCDPATNPDCAEGGGDGGGGGNPPPAPTGIYVEDVKNCSVASANAPLRQARIVCKRWFKIWRGYTDDNGHFNCTKRFRNRVKVIVKTENNLAKISKIRGVRLWQVLFPVKKRLGVYDGSDLATLYYVFTKPLNANANSAGLPYWTAAMAHNSVIEFRQYSAEFGLPNPPDDLKIIVTNWGLLRGSGSTVMFNKCRDYTVPLNWTSFFLASSKFITVTATAELTKILKNRVDMTISYLPPDADYNCWLSSPHFKKIVYHELGHAQHYNQVGCDFWTAYRNAIITELSKLDQVDFSPYGTGNDATTAPIIATGEMWGNHCQYVYTNRHYGDGGTAAPVFSALMQGYEYSNTSITGLNCYLAALESHNPNSSNDVWPWVPQGLPYDLFDNRNDNNANSIIDNVSGYTYLQSFNALQADVRSIQAFRDRLLQQNNNNQQVQVNQLFTRYGY